MVLHICQDQMDLQSQFLLGEVCRDLHAYITLQDYREYVG